MGSEEHFIGSGYSGLSVISVHSRTQDPPDVWRTQLMGQRGLCLYRDWDTAWISMCLREMKPGNSILVQKEEESNLEILHYVCSVLLYDQACRDLCLCDKAREFNELKFNYFHQNLQGTMTEGIILQWSEVLLLIQMTRFLMSGNSGVSL